MKDNKVLSAIYGIALFVALIGVIGLLYNASEMLNYTTFYEYANNGQVRVIGEEYYDLQYPIAVAMLVASVIGIIGVGAGVGCFFVKKSLLKIIFLSCVAVAIVAVVAALIVVCSRWNTYYVDHFAEDYEIEGTRIIVGSSSASVFAIYSASLTSVIQSLVCFVVIAAVAVYDFVKGIFNKKKDSKTEEVVVGEN